MIAATYMVRIHTFKQLNGPERTEIIRYIPTQLQHQLNGPERTGFCYVQSQILGLLDGCLLHGLGGG